jgi:TetR/AcrR family transcriptional regulator, transcriptional repressor for nem operon
MDDRRLTRKGRATRDRIVEAAGRLIAEHGVAGTSTEQVRRAAGVGGSQLSHYFGSKQELVRAVITRQADLVGGGSVDVGPLDSLEALEAWADAAVARTAESAAEPECSLTSLAGELSGADPDARAAISGGFLRWQAALRDGLLGMQERGDLRADADPDVLALALLTALQGGASMSQTLGEARPMRVAMDAALAYVRSFSAARPGPARAAPPPAGTTPGRVRSS